MYVNICVLGEVVVDGGDVGSGRGGVGGAC